VKTKVGAPDIADDPGRFRRFAVAIPCAIALTLAFFAFAFLRPPAPAPSERAPVTAIVIERRPPTPPPTPRPTPPPTLPPVPHVTLAPRPQRAAPRVAVRPAAAQAAPRLAPQVSAPAVVAAPAPGAGQGEGNAPGPGAGAGNATSGGTGGTGSGTVNVDQPCGDVEFVPDDAPRYRGSTAAETIRATVRFPDGHTEAAEFPYPWIYPDAADTDPWSSRNIANPDFPARAQLPPPGADTSRSPELIRYILNHTRPDGTTVLQDCPNPR
jgi:hypothetical protein